MHRSSTVEPESALAIAHLRDLVVHDWRLTDPEIPGSWDPRNSSWSISVLDSTEVPWVLRVAAKDVGGERLKALQRAIDRLYREALG